MTNKVFQHSLHRELWQWLADNPEYPKYMWHRWDFNGGDVTENESLCFACEYTDVTTSGCSDCPLVWQKKHCGLSWFGQWQVTLDHQERTRLALLIRDLPVKDGVVTE